MTKEEQNNLLTELMQKLNTLEKTYQVEGTPMLTVKLDDGTYRKKPAAATEYYPTDAYMGATDAIFCFTPEDPQEWATAEVQARHMDTTFPLFLPDMQDWAVKRFMPGNPSRAAAIEAIKSVSALVPLIFTYAAEDEAKAADFDPSQLTSLPTFGMF